MILPDVILKSKQNQRLEFSGIDHYNQCLDKLHFCAYPYNVDYAYNSRGFRDQEWPESKQELQNAIWCIGDSFTVGLGSPITHTWPWCLSKISNRRVINVSMDGASNQWISRISKKIIETINPARIAIMWSYTHRREHQNDLLNNEQRRLYSIRSTPQQDWDNFLHCKTNIELGTKHLVQFAIPNFHNLDIVSIWNNIKGETWPVDPPATAAEFYTLPQWILSEIKHLHNCFDEISSILNIITQNQFDFIPVERQDIARDGHHFDSITAEWVAVQAAHYLSC